MKIKLIMFAMYYTLGRRGKMSHIIHVNPIEQHRAF